MSLQGKLKFPSTTLLFHIRSDTQSHTHGHTHTDTTSFLLFFSSLANFFDLDGEKGVNMLTFLNY